MQLKVKNKFPLFYESKLSIVAFLATLIVSTSIAFLVPFGNDTAAHLHLTELFRLTNSLAPYDPWWYFGKVEFVGYSLAYYPLAAITNVYAPPIIALSATSAIVTWGVYRKYSNGKPAKARTKDRAKLYGFTFICSVNLAGLMLTGAYPFLSSLPFFALASLMLNRRRNALCYSFLIVIGSLFSIIATLWIGTLALAIAITRLIYKTSTAKASAKYLLTKISPLIVVAIAELLSTRNLFPKGSYPFYLSDLLELSIFLALIALYSLRNSRIEVAIAAAIYFIGAVVNFAFVQSSLGGNIARIGEFAPTITAALVLLKNPFSESRYASRDLNQTPARAIARVKGSAEVVSWSILVITALWSIFWFGSFTSEPLTDPGTAYLQSSSNWIKLASKLHSVYGNQRVEYVDTALHEGAYFLPKYRIAIARGWFRQSDQPDNALFYASKSTFSKDYKSWLCSYDIAAVILPPGPYDYSSEQEAHLVVGGASYLKPSSTIGRFQIFSVTGCSSHTKVEVYPNSFQVTSAKEDVSGTIPIHFASQLHPSAPVVISEQAGLVAVHHSISRSVTIAFK